MSGRGTMPDRFFTKLKYMETVTFTGVGWGANQYLWRANSIFDPNQTGTGHQPYGMDQWATWYSEYVVYGCKIWCNCLNQGGGGTLVGCAVMLNWGNSFQIWSPAAIAGQWEVPKVMFRDIAAGSVGPSHAKLSKYINIAPQFGVSKKTLFVNDDYAASTGANPAVIANFSFSTSQDDGNASNMVVRFVLKYYVMFRNRLNVATS